MKHILKQVTKRVTKSLYMDLTSLDFARLFSWMAYYRYDTILNKTQMQKLLYIFYGIYLAENNEVPFDDDTPKAWPHGPVFPRVSIRYNPKNIPDDLSDAEKDRFLSNRLALRLVDKIVKRFHTVSAYKLSEWSHQKGSPWYITIFGEDGQNKDIKWNAPIDNEYTKRYFKNWNEMIDNGK